MLPFCIGVRKVDERDLFCSKEMVGRHEEKLNNLEKSIEGISADIKDLRVDIKEEIRDLIQSMEKMMNLRLTNTEKRVTRLENLVYWIGGGTVAAVIKLMWERAVG